MGNRPYQKIPTRNQDTQIRCEKSQVNHLLSDHSPLPLYHRLYLILRERIVDGTYRADDMLPTESELMATFGISRITVKRALNDLAAEGLVERSRGRGTTVTEKSNTLRVGSPILANIEGLLASLSAIGQGTSVEIKEFGYIASTAMVAEQLQIASGTTVQRVSRIRHLNDEPFSHSTSHVLEDIGRTFTPTDMVKIPLIDLIHRAGITIGRVRQAITCTLADEFSATYLNVSVGSPLLKLRRVFIDTNERPVDYAESFYTPDRFEYRMTWSRDASNQLQIDTDASPSSL